MGPVRLIVARPLHSLGAAPPSAPGGAGSGGGGGNSGGSSSWLREEGVPLVLKGLETTDVVAFGRFS